MAGSPNSLHRNLPLTNVFSFGIADFADEIHSCFFQARAPKHFLRRGVRDDLLN